MEYHAEISAELRNAERARQRGNEGQARVCARRAAGIAIREYLIRKGIRPPSQSAMDLLSLIKDDPNFPPDLKLTAHHLTMRVTKEFKLPLDIDLIDAARRICNDLLKQNP